MTTVAFGFFFVFRSNGTKLTKLENIFYDHAGNNQIGNEIPSLFISLSDNSNPSQTHSKLPIVDSRINHSADRIF
jgi:hypothetical protein